MPRYQIITVGDRRYFPMRYDDFPVGERQQPVTALVPYCDSLDEALGAVNAHVESLLAPLRRRFTGTSADVGATYRDKLANPTIFFRGQTSIRHSIVPSRLRLGGVVDPAGEIRRRIGAERERATAIQNYYSGAGKGELDELQARAVARHFGAPSALVDFTFDPEVAAAFAQPAFNPQEERDQGAPLGILYAIDMGQLQEIVGMMAWGVHGDGSRDIHLVNVKSTWEIQFLEWDAESGTVAPQVLSLPVPDVLRREHARLRTCIVPGVSRIEAQRGLFLELSLDDETEMGAPLFFWTALDFLAAKWCFRRSDNAYVAGASERRPRDLFHEEDAELVRVAGGEIITHL